MTKEDLEATIDRCLNDHNTEPSEVDLLRLYVELPHVILRNTDHPNQMTPIKVRSSFEAAYSDVGAAHAGGIRWLAAIGDLVFFDQVGGAVNLDAEQKAVGPSDFERCLQQFSGLGTDAAAALYALRCALAHDYSLVNLPDRGAAERQQLLRHRFELSLAADAKNIVTFPASAWSGVGEEGGPTLISLTRLHELATVVRGNVIEAHTEGQLSIRPSALEFRRRYFFTHPVGVTEWDAQQN